VLRESTLFKGVRGLYTNRNQIFQAADLITSYPENENPCLLAKNQYRIYTDLSTPDIVVLTEPIVGKGMGSFINSNYGSFSPKNVDFRYLDGVMYVNLHFLFQNN
jgi:hypothetical protein